MNNISSHFMVLYNLFIDTNRPQTRIMQDFKQKWNKKK